MSWRCRWSERMYALKTAIRERIDALGVGERAGCAVTVVHGGTLRTQTVGAGNG